MLCFLQSQYRLSLGVVNASAIFQLFSYIRLSRHPKAGVILYPTTRTPPPPPLPSSPLRKHLHRFPTPSSSPGANTLFTYKNTESVGLQSSFLRRKLTTVSNFWEALILKIRVLRCGAEPTGWKRTVTVRNELSGLKENQEMGVYEKASELVGWARSERERIE